MGLALNNSKAVFEGIINKKSEFVRTPKFIPTNNFSVGNKYLADRKFSLLLLLEIFFSIYTLLGVIASIYFLELAALPFNLMFFLGFFSISALSLKQVLTKN